MQSVWELPVSVHAEYRVRNTADVWELHSAQHAEVHLLNAAMQQRSLTEFLSGLSSWGLWSCTVQYRSLKPL